MKTKLLMLIIIPLLLASCGLGSNNFNKQKYTGLKQMEPKYAEQIEDDQPLENEVMDEEELEWVAEEDHDLDQNEENEYPPYTTQKDDILVDHSTADHHNPEVEMDRAYDYEKIEDQKKSEETEMVNRNRKDREDFQKSRTLGVWMIVLAILACILGMVWTIVTWSSSLFYGGSIIGALLLALAFYFLIRSFYQNPNSSFSNKKLAAFGLGSLWFGIVIGSIGFYLAAETFALAGLGLTMFWIGIAGLVAFAVLMILAARLSKEK